MSTSEFLSRAGKTLHKKAQITEVDIEDEFCKYATKLKCKAIKLIFLSKKGFPDRTVLCPGQRILFIEFKRKGKSQTPLQIKVQKMLESFGFYYYVCDEIGKAEKCLEKFLSGSPIPTKGSH